MSPLASTYDHRTAALPTRFPLPIVTTLTPKIFNDTMRTHHGITVDIIPAQLESKFKHKIDMLKHLAVIPSGNETEELKAVAVKNLQFALFGAAVTGETSSPPDISRSPLPRDHPRRQRRGDSRCPSNQSEQEEFHHELEVLRHADAVEGLEFDARHNQDTTGRRLPAYQEGNVKEIACHGTEITLQEKTLCLS
ncbi:hypothetical protein P153DRAFT_391140 [Dothidotthia symphoricarpi CBS 119687]|uniref:Uncharacterized protein n=1 Tax=Dothidotthia symphoricarpi CBS 119687 TaxID=1392245 RepID=A0A6A5ZXH5_9PLEO|nr:uncharacterized protein P153DRAFT_391140 [Dothidotthia symphoricarpi CBS 119687]KAF2123725.1 hypothetical protein P153DRAFT_391140 [Dothidotthia symphoricarpi CBS 119687]